MGAPFKVFLSYRRKDDIAAAMVGRIFDRMTEHYGSENVFMDVSTIPPGVPFDRFLGDSVAEANVLLALIGTKWVELLHERDGNEDDFVRIEIESALGRGIPVVPVLLGGATMPSEEELTGCLAGFSRHNAVVVDGARDFGTHVDRLMADLDRQFGGPGLKSESTSTTEKGQEDRSGIQRNAVKAVAVVLGLMVAIALAWSAGLWRDETSGSGGASAGTESGGPSVRDGQVDPATGEEAAVRENDYTTNLGIEMVWCASGKFLMGSPVRETRRSTYELQHEVIVKEGFWIGRFEITQAQWKEVMIDNPSQATKAGPDAPVERVTWLEVIEFCQTLTEREQKAGALPDDWIYTLPSEEQWEYACRAGTLGPFHFGAELNGRRANCGGNYPYGMEEKGPYLKRPISVGHYDPNPWGIHDMHGNVEEWCLDHFARYKLEEEKDPVEPGPRATRSVRGGGWRSYPADCRSAARKGHYSHYRSGALGFRVVRVKARSD